LTGDPDARAGLNCNAASADHPTTSGRVWRRRLRGYVLVVDSAELLAIAVSVARAAAGLARGLRDEGVGVVDTKTTPTDVVTAADKAVEHQVVEALRHLRPRDSVLGEETGASGAAVTGAVRWILDPIDGTVNYLYGLPQYAVSLAAEVEGEVVAGVVRNPPTALSNAMLLRTTWSAGRSTSPPPSLNPLPSPV
jgi:myo-inositol-1(or 4)-monophosphatase